jgi:hypothetical protein
MWLHTTGPTSHYRQAALAGPGNALLMELANGNGVAVISAPRSVITFADEDLPVVDLNWAFK